MKLRMPVVRSENPKEYTGRGREMILQASNGIARPNARRSLDRALITKYILQGHDLQTAYRLCQEEDKNYAASLYQAYRDYKSIEKIWTNEALSNLDMQRGREVRRIDQLESTYWELWSSNPVLGRVEALKGIERCIDRRCKLLGLDKLNARMGAFEGTDGKGGVVRGITIQPVQNVPSVEPSSQSDKPYNQRPENVVYGSNTSIAGRRRLKDLGPEIAADYEKEEDGEEDGEFTSNFAPETPEEAERRVRELKTNIAAFNQEMAG